MTKPIAELSLAILVVVMFVVATIFVVQREMARDRADGWHAQLCAERLRTAPAAADSLAIVQEDAFCLEERE